jgi:hypothetical protein
MRILLLADSISSPSLFRAWNVWLLCLSMAKDGKDRSFVIKAFNPKDHVTGLYHFYRKIVQSLNSN